MYRLVKGMPFEYSMALFLFFAALLAFLVFLLGRSVYYSLKGQRLKEVQKEHKAQTVEREIRSNITPENEVKAIIIQRIDGIKNKNAQAIEGLVDRDRYTKFDDWPPFERQDSTALKREADAINVLKEYDYETTNWKIDIFGDAALASFTISYRGTIRDLEFSIRSRITAFLVRKKAWKLIHEHWSRFHEP